MTEIRSALPQRSPKPLIVPCTCTAPASTAGQRIGHGQLAIVVAMNADRHRQRLHGRARQLGDFLGHAAAVGVAEHDHRGAGLGRRLDGLARRSSGLAFQPSKKCSAS